MRQAGKRGGNQRPEIFPAVLLVMQAFHDRLSAKFPGMPVFAQGILERKHGEPVRLVAGRNVLVRTESLPVMVQCAAVQLESVDAIVGNETVERSFEPPAALGVREVEKRRYAVPPLAGGGVAPSVGIEPAYGQLLDGAGIASVRVADCGCGQRPREASAFTPCPLWQSVQDIPSCAPVGVRSSDEPAIPSAFAAWQFAQRRLPASGARFTGLPSSVTIFCRKRFFAGKLVRSLRE